jgi:hypothetical protein
MIISQRELLLESDFSMCLAYLLNFEEPADPCLLMSDTIRIKKRIMDKLKKQKLLQEKKLKENGKEVSEN